jgi:cytochrome c oxidase subunit 1
MAILLILTQLVFVVNFFWSMMRGQVAEDNPWQANTLEWTTASPPPHANFATAPAVYRWPYDYSLPDAATDWLAQNDAGDGARAAVR